jgi:hypothetical protein
MGCRESLTFNGALGNFYISWPITEMFGIQKADGADGLFIGIQPLAKRLCNKVNEFKVKLQDDVLARHRFKRACQRERTVQFSPSETDAWKRLVSSSGSRR